MRKYEQGALDSLCGVYSIINASRIINSLSEEECQGLFEDIIYYLDEEHSLSKLLVSGIKITILGQIMNNVDSLNISKAIPFFGKKEVSLGELWTEMQGFLEDENRAVLIGLGGVYDHWSIVESISDKRINLSDSDGLVHFDRANCTTCTPTSKRQHLIYPTQTYFLEKK